MSKQFCCYSPNNTPVEKLEKCECPFFVAADTFKTLFTDNEGVFWCDLHAPLSRTLFGPRIGPANQKDLFVNAVSLCLSRGQSRIDLRRTNWLVEINSNFLRELSRSSQIEHFDFGGSTFAKGLKWAERRFSLDFSSAKFGNDVLFDFLGSETNFTGVQASKNLTISKHSGKTTFDRAVIDGALSIGNVENGSRISLHETKSKDVLIQVQGVQGIMIDSRGVRLRDSLKIKIGDGHRIELVKFSSAIIEGSINILGGVTDGIDFKKSNCGSIRVESNIIGDANFRKLDVGGRAKFSNCSFHKMANFEKSRIRGDADFRNAVFLDAVTFKGTTFGKDASFRNAAFSHSANFTKSQFHGEVNFEPRPSSRLPVRTAVAGEREDFRSISFNQSEFHKVAIFTNRKFRGPLSCRNAKFFVAPNFHGCAFHQDTSFRGAQFFDTDSESATEAYRTIKLTMETARAKDEEARFYSLEQRSWRKHAKGSPILRAVSWLYDFGSDYGRSIGKPCGLTLLIGVVFCFAYWSALSWEFSRAIDFCVSQPSSGSGLSSWEIAIRHMFTQIVRPFEALTLRAGGYGSGGSGTCVIPGGLASISTVQTLLHLGSIALVFLAIRRRFKMD